MIEILIKLTSCNLYLTTTTPQNIHGGPLHDVSALTDAQRGWLAENLAKGIEEILPSMILMAKTLVTD